MSSPTSGQLFIGGALAGYASKAMNNLDITRHPYRAIIEHRIKVINFYDRYGLEATALAFGVSRSTVFLWKQRLRQAHGRLEALAPKSKAPRQRRRRNTPELIAGFIISERTKHHRLGKDKLRQLLVPICAKAGLACPSASTIGRILNDLKVQGKLPKRAKLSIDGRSGRLHERNNQPRLIKERRGSYRPERAGDLVQMDCVVKFINGMRRYVISAIDYDSEFAFSLGYSSLSSARAKDFLHKFIAVAPFEIKRVQTDNGSEFYKLFHEACLDLGLTHFWNYPRRPTMNAKIERYNRTLQEEFADYRLEDLGYDLGGFNYQLMDWLLWYNADRPHWSLKLKSPLRALLDALQLTNRQSNMLWTDTPD